MFRAVATKIAMFAFTPADGLPRTGDAANLTAYVSKDYGTVTVLGDTSATEMDATNAPGWYLFDVTGTEATADALLFTGKSSTSGVKVVGQYIHTTPNRFTTMVIDSAGLVDANTVKVGPTGAGTAQTARDIGASVLLSSGTGTGQLDITSGIVKANATQLAGQTITAAAGVTFPASIASPTNITAGTITTVTNLTNAPTSGDLTATMKTSVTTAATAATPTAAAVTGSVGSVVGLTASNLDATVSSRLASGSYTTPPTVGAIADQVWDEILSGHAVSGSTGEALSASGAAGDPWITALPGSYSEGQAGYIVGTNLDIAVGDVPTAVENADALLNRDMSVGTDSGSPTVRTVRQALRFLRNKWSLSGTTLSVKKEDDASESWSATVTTSPGADPISGSDPA